MANRDINQFCSDYICLSGGVKPKMGDWYYHEEMIDVGHECSVHQLLSGDCIVVPIDAQLKSFITKKDCRGYATIKACIE